jgi:hypothetical protein
MLAKGGTDGDGVQADCSAARLLSHRTSDVGSRVPPASREKDVVLDDDRVGTQGRENLGEKHLPFSIHGATDWAGKFVCPRPPPRVESHRHEVVQSNTETFAIRKTVFDLDAG